MKSFADNKAIVQWMFTAYPVGPCSILKRVKRGSCLVYQVAPGKPMLNTLHTVNA